jgi:hypothetical protein
MAQPESETIPGALIASWVTVVGIDYQQTSETPVETPRGSKVVLVCCRLSKSKLSPTHPNVKGCVNLPVLFTNGVVHTFRPCTHLVYSCSFRVTPIVAATHIPMLVSACGVLRAPRGPVLVRFARYVFLS